MASYSVLAIQIVSVYSSSSAASSEQLQLAYLCVWLLGVARATGYGDNAEAAEGGKLSTRSNGT